MELTILIPCLNEENSLGICIDKAKKYLADHDIDGEVLISDNGSTDNSVRIALDKGARVIVAGIKGYGSALLTGIDSAKGKYIIMGDADDSYDFSDLDLFVEKLRDGYDLVMGNRFAGGIEEGAMPWAHRYIGNPVLSTVGKILYHSKLNDWHCGLRGFNRNSIRKLNLRSLGMEFASEMVIKAEKKGLKTCEVPTRLYRDKRGRKPHLRSIPDGLRHLRVLFRYKFTD